VRCIGDPNIRFREDPVRMIRAVRFSSRLGFQIEGRTWRAIGKHHAEIVKAAPARLLEELNRLFAYRSGAAAMALLHESGMMHELLPEVADYIDEGEENAHRLHSYLTVLDKRAHPADPPPVWAWIAVLLYPLFAGRVTEAESAGKRLSHFELARELVRRAAGAVPIPKHAFFRVVHMFDTQRRLALPPPVKQGAARGAQRSRRSRRRKGQSFSPVLVVTQKSFPDALRLREVVLEAERQDAGYLKAWHDLYDKHAPQRDARRQPRRKPSRRRRRPDRGKGAKAADRPHDGTAR
jgi:poly(A) polymerase